jgi:hypothetical protein
MRGELSVKSLGDSHEYARILAPCKSHSTIRVNFVKVSPADLANPFPAAVARERIVWNVAPDDVVQNVGVASIAVVRHRTETTRGCYNGQG